MSAPTRDEPNATLTDNDLTVLERAVQSPYVSVQSAVESIVAARVEALTTDLAAARAEADERVEGNDYMHRQLSQAKDRQLSRLEARLREAEQTIANIQALADEWDGTTYKLPPGYPMTVNEFCRVWFKAPLRALLPAVPADQGNNHTKDGDR